MEFSNIFPFSDFFETSTFYLLQDDYIYKYVCIYVYMYVCVCVCACVCTYVNTFMYIIHVNTHCTNLYVYAPHVQK